MKNIAFLIFLSTLLSCNELLEMKNTTWKYDYGNGRFDELKFFEQKYVQYSAEIGEHYYGTYRVKGDSIIMNQERGEFDHEFKDDSRHRAGRSTFIMILKNGDQLGYKDNWQGDKWLNNYFFLQVNFLILNKQSKPDRSGLSIEFLIS